MRTFENYEKDIAKNKSSKTGISGPSALSELQSISTKDLVAVDVMHDILEGIFKYDMGSVSNYFVTVERFFTLRERLNDRIVSLHYGEKERNKLREITNCQIRNTFIKMYVSEVLCFLRNVGVLIGTLFLSEMIIGN